MERVNCLEAIFLSVGVLAYDFKKLNEIFCFVIKFYSWTIITNGPTGKADKCPYSFFARISPRKVCSTAGMHAFGLQHSGIRNGGLGLLITRQKCTVVLPVANSELFGAFFISWSWRHVQAIPDYIINISPTHISSYKISLWATCIIRFLWVWLWKAKIVKPIV